MCKRLWISGSILSATLSFTAGLILPSHSPGPSYKFYERQIPSHSSQKRIGPDPQNAEPQPRKILAQEMNDQINRTLARLNTFNQSLEPGIVMPATET